MLWAGANLLSAVLALAATAFYVGVYTLWLKRTSRQNIVIGGAAGAVPVLVGLGRRPQRPRPGRRSCCSPRCSSGRRRTSGRSRSSTPTTTGPPNVPMLPAVVPFANAVPPDDRPHDRDGRVHPAARARWPTSASIYTVAAVVLGAIFIAATVWLGQRPTPSNSMRVFGYSITYVTLLFAAMTLDVLV